MTEFKDPVGEDREAFSQKTETHLIKLSIDSVKKEFGQSFNELRTIINKHDPINLIKIGAPEDEYDSEVKTIIIQLKNMTTEQQVHDLIYQEFLRWFNHERITGPKDSYKELAADVFVWAKETFDK
jgi:hypothetical protein